MLPLAVLAIGFMLVSCLDYSTLKMDYIALYTRRLFITPAVRAVYPISLLLTMSDNAITHIPYSVATSVF
jgi:hypothetical protein